VADSDNHRIQKFSPGVFGWQQANINGFGNRWNAWVSSLEEFNGQLYAGTANWNEGTTIYQSSNGQNWTAVTEPGISSVYNSANPVVIDMLEFNGQLYAGTGWDGVPGQVWRAPDGTTWSQVVPDGFNSPDNFAVTNFAEFNGMIYAGTGNYNGPQIWRSSSGNSLSWTNVVTAGLGTNSGHQISGFANFNGALFAAIDEWPDPVDGLQVWRTANGTSWTSVVAGGFGDANNFSTSGFAVFNGYLYLGGSNQVSGAKIWRTNNGTTWQVMVDDAFGDENNYKVDSLYTFNNAIYAVTVNYETGVEVWRSTNGSTWLQINPDAFGDSNNFASLWSSAVTEFQDQLYYGTENEANGGEIWKFLGLEKVFLPLVKHP
jgi:hypothetical protein